MWVVNFNNRYPYCQNNPLKYTDPTGWDDDDDGTMAGYLTGMSNSSDMSMSLTAWVGSLFNASSYGSQSGLGIGQTVASITGFVPNAQLLNGETSPDAQTATLTNLYKNGNGDQVAVYTLTSGPNAGTQSAVFISAAGVQTPMDPGTAMLLMDASSTVNFDKNFPYSKASNDGGPMMAYAPVMYQMCG